MFALDDTPLQRAKFRFKQLETELKKSPDFQLYLITKDRNERLRMERLLVEIPQFKLWHMLRSTIQQANRKMTTPRKQSAGHLAPRRSDIGCETGRREDWT
jgi:hypothetical protein